MILNVLMNVIASGHYAIRLSYYHLSKIIENTIQRSYRSGRNYSRRSFNIEYIKPLDSKLF
jgi:hypothetical protein